MHDVERARVEPRRFPVAKRVVQVEPTLHAFEERESFEVTDRHAVLVNHCRVIDAQRQTLLARQAHEEKLNTSSQLRVIDVFRIAVCEAIEFAITNRRSFTSHVE